MKRKSLLDIKKSGAKAAVKKNFLKTTKRAFDKKIRKFKEAGKPLELRAKKISPIKKAQLRKQIKRIAKPEKVLKIKRPAKLEVKLRLKKRTVAKIKKDLARELKSINEVLEPFGLKLSKASFRKAAKIGTTKLKGLTRQLKRGKKAGVTQLKKLNLKVQKLRRGVKKGIKRSKAVFRRELTKSGLKQELAELGRQAKLEIRGAKAEFKVILKDVKQVIPSKAPILKITSLLKNKLRTQLRISKGKINSQITKTIQQINKKTPFRLSVKRKGITLKRAAQQALKTKAKKSVEILSRTPKGQRTIISLLRKGKLKFSKLSRIVRKRIRRRLAKMPVKDRPFKLDKIKRKAIEIVRARRKGTGDFFKGKRKGAPRESDLGTLSARKAAQRLALEQSKATPQQVRQYGADLRTVIRRTAKKKVAGTLKDLNNKASKSFTKAKKKVIEMRSKDGQVLLQKVKNVKKDIVKVGKSKTKTGLKNSINTAKKSISNAQKALLQTTKKPTIRVGTIILGKAILGSLIALAGTLSIQAQRAKERVGILAPVKPKPKPKATTKRPVIQKPAEKERVITIPDENQRLDTRSAQDQIRIITQILGTMAVASAFRLRGKRVLKSQTRLRGGIAKARKWIFNRLQKKRRAFTPDIYSLLFGIKARPGEKIKLLRKGRVFTGLERRAQVR